MGGWGRNSLFTIHYSSKVIPRNEYTIGSGFLLSETLRERQEKTRTHLIGIFFIGNHLKPKNRSSNFESRSERANSIEGD